MGTVSEAGAAGISQEQNKGDMANELTSTGNEECSTKTSLLFSLHEEVGALAKALHVFEKHGVNLLHIESRSSRQNKSDHEFYVECDNTRGSVANAIKQLYKESKYLHILPRAHKTLGESVPSFPRKIHDLDQFANRVVSLDSGVHSDYPGLHDPVYVKRRKEFADIAHQYRHGQSIPRITYTEQEIAIWGTIFRELAKLYPTHACKEFNNIFPLLIENCGYNETNIPQLEDVSQFLQKRTGFRLRPVVGFLSPRDFLADFAKFGQEIGMASLGASDEYISRLEAVYWFTIEFGLCVENNERKVYGAAILSSFGELQYCLSGKSSVIPFDPFRASIEPHETSTYQPTYFLAESFKDATEKFQQYAMTIPRPFSIHYNPYTQSIEVIDSKEQIVNMFQTLRNDMDMVLDALRKTEFSPAKID
ncbi:unnamed protein product [Adineta ricciae]|uniref:phenylalanine 4-monooxygenase n=1 Tax=Adineta ricciae TaxID=249248 RepID=A0A816AGB9_ADIRI|nr:unnamed protein product [Adineta ricciae]